jgi:hypothetical protein
LTWAVERRTGATFTAGKPAMLFELHYLVTDKGFRYLYAVSGDDKHFLTANRQSESATVPIMLFVIGARPYQTPQSAMCSDL